MNNDHPQHKKTQSRSLNPKMNLIKLHGLSLFSLIITKGNQLVESEFSILTPISRCSIPLFKLHTLVILAQNI
jgi:hypothetical protein